MSRIQAVLQMPLYRKESYQLNEHITGEPFKKMNRIEDKAFTSSAVKVSDPWVEPVVRLIYFTGLFPL